MEDWFVKGTHSLLLTHSLTYSLTHSLTHYYLLTHSLTHSLLLTHSLTHSPTHSLTHSYSLTLIHSYVGGGKLVFARAEVSSSTKQSRYRLVSTEDVGSGEAVLTIPLKLLMCKQTARNVLIKGKGKYLGDELTDTFAKNEVWITGLLTHSLTHSLAYTLTGLLTHALAYSLMHWLTHSLTHWITHSLMHWLRCGEWRCSCFMSTTKKWPEVGASGDPTCARCGCASYPQI